MSECGHIITKIEYGETIQSYYLLDDLDAWDVENGNPYYEIEKIEDLIKEFDYKKLYIRIKCDVFCSSLNRKQVHESVMEEIYYYVDDLLYLQKFIKENGSVEMAVW